MWASSWFTCGRATPNLPWTREPCGRIGTSPRRIMSAHGSPGCGHIMLSPCRSMSLSLRGLRQHSLSRSFMRPFSTPKVLQPSWCWTVTGRPGSNRALFGLEGINQNPTPKHEHGHCEGAPAARFLPHMTVAELYAMYTFMHGDDAASEAVLRKVYATEWRSALRIRKQSQHARCQDCTSDCKEVHVGRCPSSPMCLRVRLPPGSAPRDSLPCA